MSLFLYNLFLKLYHAGIRLWAVRNKKARTWLQGRKDIFRHIEATLGGKKEKRVWIHCASLGEYEQGRPVIEALRQSPKTAELKIVLSFFSPSGYEITKNHSPADYVFYLPMDGRENAERLVRLVDPAWVLFVKYEFWYHYLHTLYREGIPVFLISAAFRPSQPFFAWYGGLFRKMLGFYRHIFLQDASSQKLLTGIGIRHTTVAGDTRYDRVVRIAAEAKTYPLIEAWQKQSPILIAGSTWPDDEKILAKALPALPENWKLIIAPHEIQEKRLRDIEHLFGEKMVRYSKLADEPDAGRWLLMDNLGMLSGLYRYGTVAFIGGGFSKEGIHNILEPAVFGLPTAFGPYYKKFTEAVLMVENQLAFSVQHAQEYRLILEKLINDTAYRTTLKTEILRLVQSQQGATEQIVERVQQEIKG